MSDFNSYFYLLWTSKIIHSCYFNHFHLFKPVTSYFSLLLPKFCWSFFLFSWRFQIVGIVVWPYPDARHPWTPLTHSSASWQRRENITKVWWVKVWERDHSLNTIMGSTKQAQQNRLNLEILSEFITNKIRTG